MNTKNLDDLVKRSASFGNYSLPTAELRGFLGLAFVGDHVDGFLAMKNRTRIQRSLLKRCLRKQLLKASEAQRELISVTLGDPAIFETFYEQVMQQASQASVSSGEFKVAIAADGSPIVDNLLKLLTWFVENGPQLVRLIETILGLFGNAMTAAVICEVETR